VAQDYTPSLAVKATSSLNMITDFDEGLLSFGFGAEARLGQKFTVGANMTFGSEDNYSFTMVHPEVRYYPKRAFRGFFFKGGFGYSKFRSDNDFVPLLGPFRGERGSTAGMMLLEAGIGINTIVLDHWTIGFSLALLSVFDADVDDGGVHSNIAIGYAF